MKFSIAKKDLVSAVSTAASAAAKKPSMASLGHVKVVAGEHGVVFVGTDLYVGAEVHQPCKVTEEGGALLPAKAFSDACRALADGDVIVRIDGNRVEVREGAAKSKTKHRLPWLPTAEFPALPTCDTDDMTAMPASVLLACIGSTVHAMYTGSDAGKASQAGINVVVRDCVCTATAGTGQSIARRSMECASGASFETLIPNNAIADIRRLLESAKDADVLVAARDGYFFVRHGAATVSAKLTGEVFPKIDKALSLPVNRRPVISREMAIEVLKRVLVGADGEFSHVDLSFSNGEMEMKAASGESSGAIDIDYAGEPFSLRMPGGVMVNALSALTHNEVAIQVSTEVAPVLFVPATGDGQIQVVAPAAKVAA